MRAAADPFAFAHDEQVTLTAALLELIDADLSDRRSRDGQEQVRAAVQRTLAELDPAGWEPGGTHRLQDPAALRARLAAVEDTATGIALLVELCACQPWAALQPGRPLDRQARRRTLGDVALALGGDTTPDDVEQIDRILRHGELSRWWPLAVPGCIGLGLLTARLAAPSTGPALGTTMGLRGAGATNAGLAAVAGGSTSAGMVVAGGRAIITGVGRLTVAGAGAATSQLLLADDLSTQALRAQARKQRAFVARVTAHGQSNQAKAQAVINLLHEQVAALAEEIARLRRKGDSQDAQIEHLQAKVSILAGELSLMDRA